MHGIGGRGRGAEPAGLVGVGEELREFGLDNRRDAGVHALDLGGVDVDAHHGVSLGRHATGADRPDVTQTEDADIHGALLL